MAPGKRRGTTGSDATEGPGGVTLDRAFVELRPAMFALAYRMTGNRADAEEIVQDAFVRLHDAAPNDAVRSLKAYLAKRSYPPDRTALRALVNDLYRREKATGEV